MVASAIVAGFAGVVLVIKLGFRRIGGIFSPKRRTALRAEKAASGGPGSTTGSE